ncbi:tRNA lysidine(34) synthetase TilS [Siminovitchia fortis]|uniref:tRNA(Ile)-lysidine synthase n=1 Tax=Siminovitchia fortis TaxID=254758 RepID=A0A443IJT5_9BACI|nr:tRNA lysidine(34) synthetase TilS [Siminovitchia fortis]RWR04722.1 tRNA lysidine(34) synthetase TilS [Siminovitchia fortis]WHY81317.1 tRNA lysidine(34) synthetase TilS [Siminovitchia fortis]
MLDFERKTLSFIKRHGLLDRGDFVLAAVSGGPDSMAMLDFLVKRKGFFNIRLAVVHVDHMLRGEESAQDLEFVKAYCKQNQLEMKASSIDIKQKMEMENKGMQETARKHRYRFFESVMKEHDADKLAVAQHADDQIETILMRLTRGSSGKSRAGIQPARPFGNGTLIRPLLGVTKEEIEEYCAFHQLKPRIDPSNEKPAYTRNRFRLEVLPVLKRENQQVHEHFQRFSEDLLEDEAYLEALAEREIKGASVFENGKIQLDIPSFLQMPLPLQRRGIHLILSYLYKKNVTHVTAWHAGLIRELLQGENPSGRLDLPLGLQVARSYGHCVFSFNDTKRATGYEYELSAGREIILPDGGTVRMEKDSDIYAGGDEDYIVLNEKEIKLPLIVRTRRAGDRIRVKGMNGTKKLKDLFIDEKIPRLQRDCWPVITDRRNQILWVPGLKKSIYDAGPQCHGHRYILYYRTSGGQQRQ